MREALLIALAVGLLAGSRAELGPGVSTIEISPENITAALEALDKDSIVLLEGFAPWCGACQRFQPTYFEVGDLYRREREDGVGPVKVYAARMNCGTHSRLCGRFGVSHFPTMLLGTPGEVLNATKKHPLVEIRPAARTVEEVRRAVAAALAERDIAGVGATAGGSDAAKAAQDFVDLTKNSFRPDTRTSASIRDIETATIVSWNYAVVSSEARGQTARAALVDWVSLLVTSHPSPYCREGAVKAAAVLPQLWPEDAEAPLQELEKIIICPGLEPQPLESCGTRNVENTSPGYTCALWQLLHSTVQSLSDDPDAGSKWLRTARSFLEHYFGCSECRENFVTMTTQPEALVITNRRDAVLWLWRAHAAVTERIAKEQHAPRDPERWPSDQQCPSCREGEAWNEDEVYAMLDAYYRVELAKEASSVARSLLMPSIGGRARKAGATWGVAALVVVCVLAICVAALRRTPQYARPRRPRSML